MPVTLPYFTLRGMGRAVGKLQRSPRLQGHPFIRFGIQSTIVATMPAAFILSTVPLQLIGKGIRQLNDFTLDKPADYYAGSKPNPVDPLFVPEIYFNVWNENKTKLEVTTKESEKINFTRILKVLDDRTSFSACVFKNDEHKMLLVVPKGMDRPSEFGLPSMIKDGLNYWCSWNGFNSFQDIEMSKLMEKMKAAHSDFQIVMIGYSQSAMFAQGAIRRGEGNALSAFANVGQTGLWKDTYAGLVRRLSGRQPRHFPGVSIDTLTQSDRTAELMAVGPQYWKAKNIPIPGNGHLTLQYVEAAKKARQRRAP